MAAPTPIPDKPSWPNTAADPYSEAVVLAYRRPGTPPPAAPEPASRLPAELSDAPPLVLRIPNLEDLEDEDEADSSATMKSAVKIVLGAVLLFVIIMLAATVNSRKAVPPVRDDAPGWDKGARRVVTPQTQTPQAVTPVHQPVPAWKTPHEPSAAGRLQSDQAIAEQAMKPLPAAPPWSDPSANSTNAPDNPGLWQDQPPSSHPAGESFCQPPAAPAEPSGPQLEAPANTSGAYIPDWARGVGSDTTPRDSNGIPIFPQEVRRSAPPDGMNAAGDPGLRVADQSGSWAEQARRAGTDARLPAARFRGIIVKPNVDPHYDRSR